MEAAAAGRIHTVNHWRGTTSARPVSPTWLLCCSCSNLPS